MTGNTGGKTVPLSELPHLIEEVKSLHGAIEAFDERITRRADELDDKATKARRDNYINYAIGALAIITLLILAYFVRQQDDTTQRLEAQQQRLTAQQAELEAQQDETKRIRGSSCGFYQLMLSFQSPEVRASSRVGVEKYDAGIQSLKDLMAGINCPVPQ